MKKIHTKTNSLVTVIGDPKSGWANVRFPDGTQKKVRTGELTEAPKSATTSRAARPAGVIGGERVTKIGDSSVDLSHYFIADEKTASGRRAMDCNDEVGQKLRGKGLDDAYAEAAKALGVTVKELQKMYGHLNPGMQRMCLGNRLRGQASKAAAEAEAAA